MLTARTLFLVGSLGLLGSAGCEKASKALSDSDMKLLHDVPAGNVALIGGNFIKLQNWMSTAFGKATADMMAKQNNSDSYREYMKCFGELSGLSFLGGVALRSPAIEIRGAFGGLKLTDIQRCAQRSNYPTTLDADGKFLALDLPYMTTTLHAGYIVLPDGAIYFRQVMAFGAVPNVTPTTRADLEADLSKLATATAADDKSLVALAEKADRGQTMWFAATGQGTPLADKVGDLYGGFDLDHGFAGTIVAQVVDAAVAEKIETGFAKVKNSGGALGDKIKAMIDNLELRRDGDRFTFKFKLTDEQVAYIMSFAGTMPRR